MRTRIVADHGAWRITLRYEPDGIRATLSSLSARLMIMVERYATESAALAGLRSAIDEAYAKARADIDEPHAEQTIAINQAFEALKEAPRSTSLPVIRTCGQCACCSLDRYDGAHEGVYFCDNRAVGRRRLGNSDLCAPPAWCPLREMTP